MIADPLGDAEARGAAIERYEESKWFACDAWEAVADAQPATAKTAPLDLGDVLDRAIEDDRKDRRNEHIRRKRSEAA